MIFIIVDVITKLTLKISLKLNETTLELLKFDILS